MESISPLSSSEITVLKSFSLSSNNSIQCLRSLFKGSPASFASFSAFRKHLKPSSRSPRLKHWTPSSVTFSISFIKIYSLLTFSTTPVRFVERIGIKIHAETFSSTKTLNFKTYAQFATVILVEHGIKFHFKLYTSRESPRI